MSSNPLPSKQYRWLMSRSLGWVPRLPLKCQEIAHFVSQRTSSSLFHNFDDYVHSIHDTKENSKKNWMQKILGTKGTFLPPGFCMEIFPFGYFWHHTWQTRQNRDYSKIIHCSFGRTMYQWHRDINLNPFYVWIFSSDLISLLLSCVYNWMIKHVLLSFSADKMYGFSYINW